MEEELVLCSAATLLSYRIAEHYYKGRHYVWCAPFLNGDFRSGRGPAIKTPPSADPIQIYYHYLDAVESGDTHSSYIDRNRVGLRRGSGERKKQGVITKRAYNDILEIVEYASLQDFRPIMYIVPFAKVKDSIEAVPPNRKAGVFSQEFIIRDLKEKSFHITQIHRK